MQEIAQRLSAVLSDRYRIERELGRGGMATVFLAADLKHHRQVAIKVLDPEIAAAIGPERFQREIETVAQLTHPHILPLHDSGVADGLLYYVMPYVDGESLRDRLTREKQLPIEDALRITREVGDALGHAHAQGVIHRDVKPENILLEAGHAVVADFGVARAMAGGTGMEKLTATGVAVGTPAYMSPEQASGGAAGAPGDVYALGCMAYEMLAGQPPFTGPSLESIVFQHLNAPPPRVTAIRPAVPEAVSAAIVKAMAKSPADRFATTGRFVAALESYTTAPAESVRAVKPGGRVRWAAASSAVAVVAYVSLAAWQPWWPFVPGRAAPPAKKDWILMAEFEGPPGDSAIAPAARSLLSAALDQSRIVATVPQDQIEAALEKAGKPKRSRLDPALAREIAYRSAVRAVVEGTVGRIGDGYSVVVKVADADTNRVILTLSGTAKNDDALIPVLGDLGKKLRRGLGENRDAIRATRSMALVATPSFEAYRLFVEALARYRRGTGNRRAIRDYRAALALDPDFATAWLAMAFPFLNLGFGDSALICLAEAEKRPQRLSIAQQQFIERLRADVERDYPRELAAFDQILADDPGNVSALTNCSDLLWKLGRIEEALARTRKAMRLSPFGPNEAHRINETASLMLLRRFDEARAANRRQTGIFRIPQQIMIEQSAGRFAAAESIATAASDDPRLREDAAEGLEGALAQCRFGRGSASAAAEGLKRSIELCARVNDYVGANLYRSSWIAFSAVSEGALPLPPDPGPRDTSTSGLLVRGLWAAAAAKPALARQCLDIVHARPRRAILYFDLLPTLLEAKLAAMTGHPEEAVRVLRPIATPGYELGVDQTGVRWYLADAFEQAGRPDSAVAYLERTDFIPFTNLDALQRPYVERRLAVLYARLGNVPGAESHLAEAERMLDKPDPAVRRLLDDARSAVRAARGMGQPARTGATGL